MNNGYNKTKFICNICGGEIKANKNDGLRNGFKYCTNCCKYVPAKRKDKIKNKVKEGV